MMNSKAGLADPTTARPAPINVGRSVAKRRASRPALTAAPRRPRVQLDLTPRAYERVLELVQSENAENVPDLLRKSLKLLDFYSRQRAEGHRVLVERNGQLTEIEIL